MFKKMEEKSGEFFCAHAAAGLTIGICILMLMNTVPMAYADDKLVDSEAEKGWKMDKPLVTYWAGPMPMTDADAKYMSEGGFTVAWVGSPGKPKDVSLVTFLNSQLDILERHNLRGIISVGMITRYPERNKKIFADPQKTAKIVELIEGVKNHPALYGYNIMDEPGLVLFDDYAHLKRLMLKTDPNHLVFMNLYPNCANSQQLGIEDANAYRKYIDRFVEKVEPQMLVYDHYPFPLKGYSSSYFHNIAVVREAAVKADIPYASIIQLCNWATHMRTPTGEELRWQVNTLLAYGAQGISWYVYCHPGHDRGMVYLETNPELAKKMGPGVVFGGEPTPIYYYAKELHKEFSSIATELQPLKSIAAYHIGQIPKGTKALPKKAEFYVDPPLEEYEKRPFDDGSGYLIGYFGKAGKPTHALLVNMSYATYSASGQKRRDEFLHPIQRELVGPSNLDIFNVKTGIWTPANSDRVDLRLPAGGGILVRVAR